MILESLVTTCDREGRVNLAPMGPVVDIEQTDFVLRPFHSSKTYVNLRATGRCVVHVTDDVLLIARSVINQLDETPAALPEYLPEFHVLADSCRWFALEISQWDDQDHRSLARCRVVRQGRIRDFWGFCRAKHAVLEAAILASRIHLSSALELRSELDRLRPWVDKTGGVKEANAFDLLERYILASFHTAENPL